MECSIAVNCFLFEVAEKVILYLFFIQDVLASWLLLLQLENSFHLVLHACCIPVTAEMKMLRCSSKHSSSIKKTPPPTPPENQTQNLISKLWKSLIEKTLWPVVVTNWCHLKSDHLAQSLVQQAHQVCQSEQVPLEDVTFLSTLEM